MLQHGECTAIAARCRSSQLKCLPRLAVITIVDMMTSSWGTHALLIAMVTVEAQAMNDATQPTSNQSCSCSLNKS